MSVTPALIATALGQAAPISGSTTEAQWQLWIDDATMLIESRRLEVDAALVIDQAKLDYVVREAVVAHVRNPDDASQVAVSIDDGSVSRSYRSSKGRVTILDEWWTLLGLTASGGQAFDLDTVRPGANHAPFCNLYFGGTFCTCGASIGTTYYLPSEL